MVSVRSTAFRIPSMSALSQAARSILAECFDCTSCSIANYISQNRGMNLKRVQGGRQKKTEKRAQTCEMHAAAENEEG